MENLECVDGIIFLNGAHIPLKICALGGREGVYNQSWRGEQEKSSYTW